MLEEGDGIEKNFEKAVKWYREAHKNVFQKIFKLTIQRETFMQVTI